MEPRAWVNAGPERPGLRTHHESSPRRRTRLQAVTNRRHAPLALLAARDRDTYEAAGAAGVERGLDRSLHQNRELRPDNFELVARRSSDRRHGELDVGIATEHGTVRR